MKAILLKGKGLKEEVIELNKNNELEEILTHLNSKDEYHTDINHFSFGVHEDYMYEMYWNGEEESNTCMEITVCAGADYPIFIDSKVIIICHCFKDGGYLKDINIKELKKYFNTENTFWALIKQ